MIGEVRLERFFEVKGCAPLCVDNCRGSHARLDVKYKRYSRETRRAVSSNTGDDIEGA